MYHLVQMWAFKLRWMLPGSCLTCICHEKATVLHMAATALSQLHSQTQMMTFLWVTTSLGSHWWDYTQISVSPCKLGATLGCCLCSVVLLAAAPWQEFILTDVPEEQEEEESSTYLVRDPLSQCLWGQFLGHTWPYLAPRVPALCLQGARSVSSLSHIPGCHPVLFFAHTLDAFHGTQVVWQTLPGTCLFHSVSRNKIQFHWKRLCNVPSNATFAGRPPCAYMTRAEQAWTAARVCGVSSALKQPKKTPWGSPDSKMSEAYAQIHCH